MATEEQSEGLAFHPMDQFIVKPLFGGDTIAWYTPTNMTLWMALAVLASFALFVPGGIPGEVVVDDGVEQALQVDAFAQAVGGHEHPFG